MRNNERLALRVLGQKEMLYKLHSTIMARFRDFSMPIRQRELHKFMQDLLQDIQRLEHKFSVRSNLCMSDLAEYDGFDNLLDKYAKQSAQGEQAFQQLFDFGKLETINNE